MRVPSELVVVTVYRFWFCIGLFWLVVRVWSLCWVTTMLLIWVVLLLVIGSWVFALSFFVASWCV